MSIWMKNAIIPAVFNGFPINILATTRTDRPHTAEHGAVGRLGSTLQPTGADSPTFKCTIGFGSSEFEAHKIFLGLLAACSVPNAPGVLIHPVWGQQEVYPVGEPVTRVDAKKLEAILDVTFARHVAKPEVLTAMGPFLPSVFDTIPAAVDLARYQAALLFIQIFSSAWLAAALTIMRLAGELPGMIDRSIASGGEALSNWMTSYFSGGFSTDNPAHESVNSRYEESDLLLARFRKEMGAREADYQGVIDGTVSYSPGIYGNGTPPPAGTTSPPPRHHAAMVFCAQWETLAAGISCNDLTDLVLAQDAAGTLDPAAADAAAIFLRGRARGAVRLSAATMPYHSGRTVTGLSNAADGLVRLLAHTRLKRPPTRTVALPRAGRPLVLLAQDYLGDASRADELRALNPDIRKNFNRLPAGTELRVPA